MRPALVLLLALAPVPALAAGRGETTLSAGPSFVALRQSDTRVGAGVDARLLYGLTDAWSVHALLSTSLLPAATGWPTTTVLAPVVGVTVAADVLNWVPFAEVSVGIADLRAGDASEQRMGGALGAGLDYLVSRHLGVTVYGRAAYWPLRLGGAAGPVPLQLGLGILVGRVF